ncbi:hypothetical protein [Campylobacter sp.]|uniref:hypothetical protein n=1 Tax=Campylobacter sp. TaxID=205 RepID=UPI00290C6A34|nr:hypothetical protein [Campylobacter sp.]MDU6827751.1 hypothetical protein [Campylobacter sp.]
MLLDEFLYKIGFEIDGDKLRQVTTMLNQIGNTAKEALKPLNDEIAAGFERNAAGLQKVDEFINKVRQKASELKQEVDAHAPAVEKTAKAVKKTDENIKKATVSSKSLKSQFEEFRNKFFLVGVVSSALSGLITNYLSKPLENINELAKQKNKLFDITASEINQAKEYQEGLKTTKNYLSSITTQVALKLLPAVNQNTRGFNNFLRANKNLVVEGLSNVGKWIIKLGQVFINSFRALNYLITKTIGWKNALLILGGVLLLLKRAMILAFIASPIGIVITAIGALMLLLDDLVTYLDGGESLFGEYWEPFIAWGKKALAWFETVKPTIAVIVGSIRDYFYGACMSTWSVFQMLVGLFTGDTDLMNEGWENLCNTMKFLFSDAINMIKNWLSELYDEYIAPIVDKINAVKDSIKNTWEDAKKGAGDAWDGFKSWFGFGDDAAKLAPATAVATQPNSYDNHATTTNNLYLTTNNEQIAQNFLNKNLGSNLGATQRNFTGR